MKTNQSRIAALLLALTALVGIGFTPIAPVAEPPPEKEKGQAFFKGRVEAVDTSARTLTVSGKTLNVTDATKLTKNGRPIVLYDVMVNDAVEGTTRRAFDGQTEATTVKVVSEY